MGMAKGVQTGRSGPAWAVQNHVGAFHHFPLAISHVFLRRKETDREGPEGSRAETIRQLLHKMAPR